MTKVFADFGGGEYGTLDAAKVPDNMWTGRNVIVYRDGSLGPRPGLKHASNIPVPPGHIYGLGHFESINWSLVYVEGNNVYRVKAPDAASPTDANLIGGITRANNQHIYMHDIGQDSGFLHTFRGETWWIQSIESPNFWGFDKLIAAPGTHGTGHQHGERLYITAANPDQFKIKYSAPADPTTWPAANVFKVGSSEVVSWIGSQRSHMAILNDDGQWSVVTGVPGESGSVLRRVTSGRARPGTIPVHAVVQGADDIVYYLLPHRSIPCTFDGSRVEELEYLSMTPEENDTIYGGSPAIVNTAEAWDLVKAIDLGDTSPGFYLRKNNGRLLTKWNNVWSQHEFSIPLSEQIVGDGRGHFYVFEEAPTNQKLYTAYMGLERPAFASGGSVFESVGDNSTTPVNAHVTFPEEWTEDGSEEQVVEVIIDFTRWNTSAALANNIQAEVTALGRHSEVTPIAVTRSWNQAGSNSPATLTGTKDRVRLNFGDQGSGAGWRLKLADLRGVAIRQVIVFTKPVTTDSRAW